MKEETPRSNRFHIGLFGRRNVGKSSLVNALTGQQVAIVSDVPGTTTDAVYKNMELPGIGAAVIVDTAGYDDNGELGELRVARTRGLSKRMDLALLMVSGCPDNVNFEQEWLALFKEEEIPVICLYNEKEQPDETGLNGWASKLGRELLRISVKSGLGLDRLRLAMSEVYGQQSEYDDLTASLVHEGDTVLLVMPQDIQAPKGRLILPQVQTMRNLLDKKCLIFSCTTDKLPAMLQALKNPPALIITDSQVFSQVERLCPPESKLTSFSILFARHKGDLKVFLQGAEALRRLSSDARILIAEACTHVPQHEDIGRVKLPALLRKRLGSQIRIDHVSGHDFPRDLSDYDLVIHCGGCMFTRRQVMARVHQLQASGVPVRNYGVAIACLNGSLDKVVFPE